MNAILQGSHLNMVTEPVKNVTIIHHCLKIVKLLMDATPTPLKENASFVKIVLIPITMEFVKNVQ